MIALPPHVPLADASLSMLFVRWVFGAMMPDLPWLR